MISQIEKEKPGTSKIKVKIENNKTEQTGYSQKYEGKQMCHGNTTKRTKRQQGIKREKKQSQTATKLQRTSRDNPLYTCVVEDVRVHALGQSRVRLRFHLQNQKCGKIVPRPYKRANSSVRSLLMASRYLLDFPTTLANFFLDGCPIELSMDPIF